MSDAWETKPCLMCGAEFEAQRWRDRKFCSPECTYAHRRARNEEKRRDEERAHQRNIEALEAYLRQRQARIAARERRAQYGVVA